MKQSFNPCDECPYSYSKNNQETGMCDICEFQKLLGGKCHHEMVDFKMVIMYRCKWCGKTFHSTRHKCMFDPKKRNCFSCEHCTGFETFNGQEAEPGTGWQWEIEPYKTFLCDLEETVDEEYGDFYKLYDRNWEGNCPYYELSDSYKGKKSYAELMNRKKL